MTTATATAKLTAVRKRADGRLEAAVEPRSTGAAAGAGVVKHER
jgi:hypothetical protein